MEKNLLNDQINIIENLFANSSIAINYTSFILSLLVAATLGFFLKRTYMHFSKSRRNHPLLAAQRDCALLLKQIYERPYCPSE